MSSSVKFNFGIFVVLMSALGFFLLVNTKQEPNIWEQIFDDNLYYVYGILYCVGCSLIMSGVKMADDNISVEWVRTAALIGLINFVGTTIVIFYLKSVFVEGFDLALKTLPLMGVGVFSAVMSYISMQVFRYRVTKSRDNT